MRSFASKLLIPVHARVKRAFAGGRLIRSQHICSGIPMLPVPARYGVVRLLRFSQKHGLACRKHAASLHVIWQEQCAPYQAQWVRDSPSGCVSGQSCGVGEMVRPLPPAWGPCASGPQPGPQQHAPGHGDFSSQELLLPASGSACKKGGSKDLRRSR